MLITVDVGGTLGVFSGPSSITVLERITAQYQGAKPAMVGEIARRFLHTAPTLTEELICEVCDYLLIPRAAWPQRWHGGFAPYHYTATVLATVSHHRLANSNTDGNTDGGTAGGTGGGTDGDPNDAVRGAVTGIVALSNISVADGPARMAQLDEKLGTWLDEIVPSYAIGTRKPHRRCWETVAARHGVHLSDIVHVGDRIPEDIPGALRAGCGGAILTNTRGVPVPDHLQAHPQVAVVDDLRGIAPIVTTWATQPPSNRIDG
jgi:FMN hydrolase / 5-amino-6-(5-phospho-D-ribitylamino)uracil phosphatase